MTSRNERFCITIVQQMFQFRGDFIFVFDSTFKTSNNFCRHLFRQNIKRSFSEKKSQLSSDKHKNVLKGFYSLSDVSRMLLMLLMSFVLQGSNGSGGDCTPPSAATFVEVDACGADFPRRFIVASSSFDSSGEILKAMELTHNSWQLLNWYFTTCYFCQLVPSWTFSLILHSRMLTRCQQNFCYKNPEKIAFSLYCRHFLR